MGYLTLSDLRDEVHQNLGGRISGHERVDRWLNMALASLLTDLKIGFDASEIDKTIATVAGTQSYALDSTCIGTKSVVDTTNVIQLVLTKNPAQYDSSTNTPHSKPTVYWRRSQTLYLWPIPDGIYTLTVVQLCDASKLVNNGDFSPLSAAWDRYLILQATSIGWDSLDKTQEELVKGNTWMTMASRYKDETLTNTGSEQQALAEGVWVPKSWEDLQLPNGASPGSPFYIPPSGDWD